MGQKHIEQAFRKWVEYARCAGDNPTRGQKAWLTRYWHDFCVECFLLDVIPSKYAEREAQP